MTAKKVLEELESLGNPSTKKTLMRHGALNPCFGVKIGDMQKVRKQVGVDHPLALELFDSGNYDAMYFAGLIADDEKMTNKDLRNWARKAYGGSLPSSTVPGVAAGNRHGWDLALEWLESKDSRIVSIGWNTISAIISVLDDAELDIKYLRSLLDKAATEIHEAANEEKEAMNGFVIAVGSFVVPLSRDALAVAEKIGKVSVDHGDTSCKTPFAPDYIRKVEKMGRVGKKRKNAKC